MLWRLAGRSGRDAGDEVALGEDEEQDARDNLPNNLQDSEKAEKMDDTIGSIEYAIGNLEETIENLDEAVSI